MVQHDLAQVDEKRQQLALHQHVVALIRMERREEDTQDTRCRVSEWSEWDGRAGPQRGAVQVHLMSFAHLDARRAHSAQMRQYRLHEDGDSAGHVAPGRVTVMLGFDGAAGAHVEAR